ncbi:MAG: hypothetical protein HYZ16_09780 [Bacteroidetes bacterium]|jgi:hypothetical protein|nr:hypothetical protein [Bacteroidota bacterium]
MKQFLFMALIGLTIWGLDACGTEDPCAGVSCVNGACKEGTCDCEVGYTGALCDEEKVPKSISVSKMTIKKFPGDNLGGTWDNAENGLLPDLTIRVMDLQNKYFEPTNLTTQVHEDATEGQLYDIPCNYKVSNLNSEVTIEVSDYDFDGLNPVFEFMGSIRLKFKDVYAGFPEVISLKSSSGKTEVDLTVSYIY